MSETITIPKELGRRIAAFIEKHDLPWDGEFCEHDLDLVSGNLEAKRQIEREICAEAEERDDQN